MEKAEGIEPAEGQSSVFTRWHAASLKKKKGYKNDTDLTEKDLIWLCDAFKKR
jgi:hypothetical protein